MDGSQKEWVTFSLYLRKRDHPGSEEREGGGGAVSNPGGNYATVKHEKICNALNSSRIILQMKSGETNELQMF